MIRVLYVSLNMKRLLTVTLIITIGLFTSCTKRASSSSHSKTEGWAFKVADGRMFQFDRLSDSNFDFPVIVVSNSYLSDGSKNEHVSKTNGRLMAFGTELQYRDEPTLYFRTGKGVSEVAVNSSNLFSCLLSEGGPTQEEAEEILAQLNLN